MQSGNGPPRLTDNSAAVVGRFILDAVTTCCARPTCPPCPGHLAEHHLKSTPAQRIPSMPQASLDCEHPPDWLRSHPVSSCPAFPATNRHNGAAPELEPSDLDFLCRRHLTPLPDQLTIPANPPHLTSTRATRPDSLGHDEQQQGVEVDAISLVLASSPLR